MFGGTRLKLLLVALATVGLGAEDDGTIDIWEYYKVCPTTPLDELAETICPSPWVDADEYEYDFSSDVKDYRVQFGLDLTSEEGLWQVRESPGKGLGVFAAKQIPRGTHIMVESPLFTLDPGEFSAAQGYSLRALAGDVERAVDSLNETARGEYLSCYEHRIPGETVSRELLIFRSNAYSMPDGRIGIFPRIAKINHSCRPNGVNVFSESRGARIIWAGRDIAPGEEVTVTYAPLTERTETRWSRLRQYGFQCDCEACLAGGHGHSHGEGKGEGHVGIVDNASDQAREEMRDLFQLLETELSKKTYTGDMLPRAERLVALVEQEVLTDYLARACRLTAYAASRNGNFVVAKRWARRELEIHELADDMSQYAREAREFLQGLPG